MKIKVLAFGICLICSTQMANAGFMDFVYAAGNCIASAVIWMGNTVVLLGKKGVEYSEGKGRGDLAQEILKQQQNGKTANPSTITAAAVIRAANASPAAPQLVPSDAANGDMLYMEIKGITGAVNSLSNNK